LKNVCDHVAINPTYLSELFKKEMGEGFNHYLVNLRLSKAQELLRENENLSIADISQLVGFQDPNYFSRLFHKRMGVTAQEYRDGKGRE
jgi:two-component system response regulator YesN